MSRNAYIFVSSYQPSLKPLDVLSQAEEIYSCEDYVSLLKEHEYICGFRSWNHFKKAFPLGTLESVVEEMEKITSLTFSTSEEETLLKLEWLLHQIDDAPEL